MRVTVCLERAKRVTSAKYDHEKGCRAAPFLFAVFLRYRCDGWDQPFGDTVTSTTDPANEPPLSLMVATRFSRS